MHESHEESKICNVKSTTKKIVAILEIIMGRYSRKDMIEFANYAKNWFTPRKVSEAYKRYLKGDRLIGKKKKK